jgi:hypothetical protein
LMPVVPSPALSSSAAYVAERFRNYWIVLNRSAVGKCWGSSPSLGSDFFSLQEIVG